jgi:hypothetical protein
MPTADLCCVAAATSPVLNLLDAKHLNCTSCTGINLQFYC